LFYHDKQAAVHHQNGYQSLTAFLPPKERRGLVLIDPPYEHCDELQKLPSILASALHRFETGIYALWYPIKTREQLTPFYRELKTLISRPILFAELCIHSDEVATQLNGCGMVIINPPWQFEDKLKVLMPWLWNVLSENKQGKFYISS
jgi:23S rRNA (adenine2030-N6)-methyltransferase